MYLVLYSVFQPSPHPTAQTSASIKPGSAPVDIRHLAAHAGAHGLFTALNVAAGSGDGVKCLASCPSQVDTLN
jgi:hypothetical protein